MCKKASLGIFKEAIEYLLLIHFRLLSLNSFPPLLFFHFVSIFAGINILAHLIKVDVSYAFRHQMTVIDCLNDPDETLKRKVRVKMISRIFASSVAMMLVASMYFVPY